MSRFEINQIEALKDYLYRSKIHDAQIKNFRYDRENKIIIIEMLNQIYGVKITMTFKEVKVVLSISGNEQGNRQTIVSLTVEEDYLYLENCIKVCRDYLGSSLYLLFQMFSGDELHIVCEDVCIET